MKRNRFLYILSMTLLASAAAHGAWYVDLHGGLSIPSPYRYFETEPVDKNTPWLTFDPQSAFCPTSRLTIDLWKHEWRVGVVGGFLRRYELHFHALSDAGERDDVRGEMISIPLLGCLEQHRNDFFYEFGLGPYITRFNYTGDGEGTFTVTSLFGFLFGGGYGRDLFPGVRLQVKAELLVNAPVFLVDYLDADIKQEIRDSRFTEYNGNEFQTIVYTTVVSAGLQYEFGKNMSIPLDRVFQRIFPGFFTPASPAGNP